MIQVTIQRSKDGFIRSFTLKGHADFAEHGKDIVCAGVSAVSFGTVNAVIKLAKVEPLIKQADGGGFLQFQLPDKMETESFAKAQVLLEGMVVSLKTIEQQYGEFIQIHINQE